MTKIQSLLYKTTHAARGAIDAVKRGWQQAWARGDDEGGSSSTAGLTNAASQSAWVFRCLQLIAGPIRSVPLEWYAANDEQTELNDTDLTAFWRRPAITSGGVRLSLGDFLELSAHWIGLKGQALWILDDTWLSPRGVKSPILLARADRLTAIKKGDELLGWQFLDGAGRGYSLLPQQVIRPRFMNPYDDAEGLAPMQAALNAASADYAAGVFARNIAASNGDQGVYVIAKGGTLSQEQQSQILAQLRQKSRLAKSGDFRAAFLTADVTIEDPKIKTVDTAFLEGRHFSRDEIACAFGVPPSMLQMVSSYSIGAASDRYRLIDETCIPMASRLLEAISQVERLRTARDLSAELDWSSHSVLSQVRNDKLKAAADVWKCGIPWAVLNDNMDLGLDDFPGSDRAWLPMSLEPVDGSTNGSADTPVRISEDDTTDSQKLLLRQGDEIQKLMLNLCGVPISRGVKSEDKRLALWNKHMRSRATSEKLFKSKLTKCLMSARAETLHNIERTEKTLAGARQRGVLDLIFNLSKFTLSLISEMSKAHSFAIEEATQQLLLEIARPDDPWRMESQQVLTFLGQRENLMKGAAKEIHDAVLTTLQEGLEKGETTAQLADRVREKFNGISNERAVMIASTETGAAYGQTRHSAIEDLDIPYKQWLSAQDDRVRDTHRKIDGVIIGSAESFQVPRKDGGVDAMQHPCDSAGSAENCIHCRCVELPVMELPSEE